MIAVTQAERDRATLAYLASAQRQADIATQAHNQVEAEERAQHRINWICAAAVALFIGFYLLAMS